MSTQVEKQAADILGPTTGGILVLSVTTSSQDEDLSGASFFNGDFTGIFVRMISDVGLYYRWSTAAGTADETATSGSDRVSYLPAGQILEERPGGSWLIFKGTAAGKVRISKGSRQ